MQDADAGMQKNSSVMTGFSIASIVVGVISFFQSLMMIGAAGLGAGLANMADEHSHDAAFGGAAGIGLFGMIAAILAIIAAIMLLVKKRGGYKVAIAASVCLGIGLLLSFAGGIGGGDYIVYLCIYGGMVFSGRSYFVDAASPAGQNVTGAPHTSHSQAHANAANIKGDAADTLKHVTTSLNELKDDVVDTLKYSAASMGNAAAQQNQNEHEHHVAVCTWCHAALKPNAKFCSKCGAAVVTAKPAEPQAASVMPDTPQSDHHSAEHQASASAPEHRRVHYRCPKCHHDVDADTTVCPGCGVHLKPHKSPQAQHKTVHYRCPKCHHELDAGTTVCPGCGVHLKPHADSASAATHQAQPTGATSNDMPSEIFCPSCGKKYSSEFKFCPYCGVPRPQV